MTEQLKIVLTDGAIEHLMSFFISFAIPVVIDQLRACVFVTHPIIALTFLRAIFRKRASRTPSNCGWTVAPPGADQSTIVASL